MPTRTMYFIRNRFFQVCTFAGLLFAAFSPGTAKGGVTRQQPPEYLVENSYFSPVRWNYHSICGRPFFIGLRHEAALWKKAGLENEPFVKDSASVIDYSIFETPDTADYMELLAKYTPVILRGKAPPADGVFARAQENFGSRYIGCFNNMTQEWTRLWVRKDIMPFVNEAGFSEMPGNRREALNMAGTLLEKRFIKYTPGQKQVIIQASLQDHYAMSLPDVALEGVEMGGACGQNPAQIACARGASRQYGKPWIAYVESLNPFDGFTDYMFPFPECSVPRGEATYRNGPACGLSPSLYKRLIYASYMGGCNLLFFEMDTRLLLANYDFRTIEKESHLCHILSDTKYFLSPVGRDLKELFDKTVMRHDRGIPYTPVGLLFDKHHNLDTPYNWDMGLGKIKFTDADYMMRSVINTIWPWEEGRFSKKGPESYCMVTSAFGDIFDILTNDIATADNLKNYPVIFLVGNVAIDEQFYKHVADYVRDGGVLFINAEQVNGPFAKDFLGVEITGNIKKTRVIRFPDNALLKEDLPFSYREIIPTTAVPCVFSDEEPKMPLMTKNAYGKGTVYLTAPYYLYAKDSKDKMLKMFSRIMEDVSREVTPCIIDGKVQYLINRNENGWVVTLINNDGITKEPFKPMIADRGKTASVKVSFKKDFEISGVMEWTTEEEISAADNSFTCVVPPGDVRIIEVRISEKAAQ